jgi:uncharacterized protein YdeI (YjbR/CyaY-like superfamily)
MLQLPNLTKLPQLANLLAFNYQGIAMNDLPVLPFESERAWEGWLEENHIDSQGVWLKIARKGVGQNSISYQEALSVALCFGWIDGQKNKFDDRYWLQKFTPRRPKSGWSKINCQKATELIEQGRMRPAGMREVERAKQDGRWDAAYESQSTATIPDDLQKALDANPAVKAFFDQLNSVNRYAMIYRITTAKKPETRRQRIEKFIAMLNDGKKIYE